ncbi:hypothetical protein GCM10009540_78940 [Streptomyces turgidiscabies]
MLGTQPDQDLRLAGSEQVLIEVLGQREAEGAVIPYRVKGRSAIIKGDDGQSTESGPKRRPLRCGPWECTG